MSIKHLNVCIFRTETNFGIMAFESPCGVTMVTGEVVAQALRELTDGFTILLEETRQVVKREQKIPPANIAYSRT